MINPTVYNLSLKLLKEASTPHGFVAAIQEQDNYKRVWTRDGVITTIAALLSGDKNLINTAKITIETLLNNQHPTGFMPSNVSPTSGTVSFGGTSGRADNPSWAVIGLCIYTILNDDESLWEKYQPEVKKCFSVMDAWEYNGKHLMYVPQSGDWADEYIQHGYILFDQLLRVWALRLASSLDKNQLWQAKAEQIVKSIQQNYWKSEKSEFAYSPNLLHQIKDASTDFWLMGFNPARIYHYFDLQANTFALLLDIGNKEQNNRLISWIKNLYEEKKFILPSFHPTIKESDVDMNELKNNYAYTFRNHPDNFHNGGLWPVWNGWLVSALLKHGEINLAKRITIDIHAANARGSLFNECLHGIDKNPSGVPKCTWSAAGAIIAEHADGESFRNLFRI